jgi:AcrR family transcriptional regulator
MRDAPKFEDRYLDVLHNLEASVLGVAKRYPDLIDAYVEQAYEALIRYYKAEARGYEPRTPNLASPIDELFENLQAIAEFHLGRGSFVNEAGAAVVEHPAPITVEEMVACFKRLRKSVDFWSRKGGRRGYLRYIEDFFPGGPNAK